MIYVNRNGYVYDIIRALNRTTTARMKKTHCIVAVVLCAPCFFVHFFVRLFFHNGVRVLFGAQISDICILNIRADYVSYADTIF